MSSSKFSHRNSFWLVALVLSCFVGGPCLAQEEATWKNESWEKPVDEAMQKRLARLATSIEAEREKLNIPGLALAVVKDGEIIFARGFGVSDVENNKPVNPETLFAIGSSSKAFTATLIGMLADDGKIQFDDPVAKHLPGFKLDVDTGEEQVTIRDLLCHRTGYTRMGILWAGGKATRPQVIQFASKAKPVRGFRKGFGYNNVMYMIAGYSAGQATNSTWEEQIADRIFKPLGMSSSSTSITEAQKDERLSLGYVWNKEKEEYKLLPMRNIDLVGPAGSINSNVLDMSQWLKFQLGKGEIDGKRLISEDRLGETWQPNITMGEGAGDYGLGWMLREWNKKQVVEHGGNIDGFGAQVSMIPEENLGYVLLTNVTATPLQGASIELVFDTLLGETKKDDADAGSAAGVDTSDFVGEYTINAGQLQNTKLKVLVQSGNLAVDVPGQMVFELKPADDEGKWYFRATNAIAVSFAKDKNGKAYSMTMYQAGMEIECPRDGAEMPIEIPLDELRPLLGTYHDEEEDKNIKVVLQNNRLAVEPEGQPAMEFFPPDEEGWRALRMNKKMLQIKFNKAEDGSIDSVTRRQRGKDVTMKRTAESETKTLPTAKDVIAKLVAGHRKESATDAGASHFQLTGKTTYVHQGADGTTTVWVSSDGAFRGKSDMGVLGHSDESVDGKDGWSESAFTPFERLEGAKLTNQQLRHPIWFLTLLDQHYENASVIKSNKVDGRDVWVLKLQGKGEVPDRTLYVDQENGLLLKEDTSILAMDIMQLPVTYTYSDFRDVGNYKLPFKSVSNNAAVGDVVIEFEKVEQLDSKPDYSYKGDAEKE